jgi:hypothetical protein
MPKYEQQLLDLANKSKTTVKPARATEYEAIYDKLKEIVSGKPFNPKYGRLLDDVEIYTLWDSIKKAPDDYDFYYDLLAMRMAKGASFSTGYKSYFDDALSLTDDEIVESVAQRIEWYAEYGNLLLGLKDMHVYPLYVNVINKLTTGNNGSPYGQQKLGLKSVLQNYSMIIKNGDFDPSYLINTLNRWRAFKEDSINADNIKNVIVDMSFFENATEVDNDLTEYIFEQANKYLDELSKEAWEEAFEDINSYEVKISLLLDEYRYEQKAVNAIKSTLTKIQKGEIEIPDKSVWANILSRTSEASKSTEFQSIRDRFCTGIDITPDLFRFFGDWLFKYAKMDKYKDVVRKIITSDILNDEECLLLLSKHTEQIPNIIQSASEDEIKDFKDTIRSLYTDDNPHAEIIAKKVGVRKSRKPSNSGATEDVVGH